MTVVQVLSARGVPFTTGPGVNIYNDRTLGLLARCGLNGIQAQSARTMSLLDRLEQIGALGVDVVRISPQSRHTPSILELVDTARRGGFHPEMWEVLGSFMPFGPCNGYWDGVAGMEHAVGPI